MITAELNKSAKEMIAKDYLKKLEEENAELLRKIVAAKEGTMDEKEILEEMDKTVRAAGMHAVTGKIEAAHAIHERMQEGVLWEEEQVLKFIESRGDCHWLKMDKAGFYADVMIPINAKVEGQQLHGQKVIVTVKRRRDD